MTCGHWQLRTGGGVDSGIGMAVEVGAARERPHFAAIRKIYNGDSGMSQVSVKELYPTCDSLWV